jgi:hypothetical protein
MRENLYRVTRETRETKLVVTLGEAEIVPNDDEGSLTLEVAGTLAAAEKAAKQQSLWYAAETPLNKDTPIYVYHADGCTPVSVWVNGKQAR